LDVSRALVGCLLAVLFVGATAAVWVGVEETRLASQGPRRDYAAEELSAGTRGWVAVFGCVRHDLAVAVTHDGHPYRLGVNDPRATDEDRVFTPMSGRDDCEEGRAPRRIFALIEDDDALGNTIGRVYKSRVAPPPVPAFVEGVIGYLSGSTTLARRAAGELGLDLDRVPLLAKGKHPGVRWVALTTVAAGLHGYALILVVAIWSRRRARSAAARDHFTDEENAFLEGDDPDQT
jgi:hypothetical protein